MSLIGLCLNLILAILLVAGLVIGVRLERRLKTVRDGQVAFARAVVELDAAAVKARNGLADLRAATDEATDMLGGRITRAREIAERLESLVRRAELNTPDPAQFQHKTPAPAGAEGGLAALLERLKQADMISAEPLAEAPRLAPAAERPTRFRPATPDDDLFEDLGVHP